ncbi:MAG: glycosyltransferase family 2 protein [Oliverpabstia sp.]
MSTQGCISVIVPVYKVEKFLPRCIESILNQTFSDYELILVDDASPDDCPQICDRYAELDKRIKVIHKTNGGLSDARNAGLEIAKGEMIAFVDSDDVIDSRYLEFLYRAIMENNCDMAVCGFEKFQEIVPLSCERYCEGRICSGYEMLWRIYSNDHTEYIESTVSWNKLYRRKLFENIRFPKGKIHEDEATAYKLYYRAKKVITIPCRLYFYYQNPAGIMKRKFNISRLDYLEALYDRYCFFERGEMSELARCTARLLYIYTVDYASMDEHQVEDYAAFHTRLSSLYKGYRAILLKQPLHGKEKLRILLSYIRFDFLIKHL